MLTSILPIGNAHCEAVVTGGYIAATEFNNQDGTNPPVLDPHRPYRLLSEVGTSGDSPLDGFLATPGTGRQWRYALTGSNSLWFCADFHQKQTLLDAFPPGTYELSVQTRGGTAQETLELAPIDFPNAPQIRPGENMARMGSRFVLTDPDAGATIEWSPASGGTDNVFVAIGFTEFTSPEFPANTTNFRLDPGLIAQFPIEEPVSCLVQFNSPSGNTATTVWLWKPRMVESEGSIFAVARGRTFVQTNNATPSPWTPGDAAFFDSDYGPFNFRMQASGPGVVEGPVGKSYLLSFASPAAAYHESGPLPTSQALAVDYPDGVYKFGDQAAALSNPIYPNSGAPIKLLSVNNRPPRWQNGKLLLDSRVSNTLVWSAFQAVRGRPFATHGIAEFTAGFISNFSAQNTDFRESGVLSVSKRPFNRHTFPKNALKSDRDYWISLRYFLASYLDPSTLSAAGANTTTYIPVSIEP